MARVIVPADFQRFYPFDSGSHRQPLERAGLPCSGVSVSAGISCSGVSVSAGISCSGVSMSAEDFCARRPATRRGPF